MLGFWALSFGAQRLAVRSGVLLVVCISMAALAQSAPEPPVPTLHVASKLVIVDVVVQDAAHKPIHGLKAADFTLLEGGKPQAIKSFEEFRAETPAAMQRILKLEPGSFTNIGETPGAGPLNILLLDKQDTQPHDLEGLRQQLLKYIDAAKPGTRIAIFDSDDKTAPAARVHHRQGQATGGDV